MRPDASTVQDYTELLEEIVDLCHEVFIQDSVEGCVLASTLEELQRKNVAFLMWALENKAAAEDMPGFSVDLEETPKESEDT